MMHKAWSSTEEVPYCFWRSSVKFQGRTALKIIKFDPNWVFPDCNSSLNLPMAMKCCTKLETAKERCPIVFQGHPSNFKVTRYKTSPILTQIGHFPTVGRSQLSNPSDLPCYVPSLIFGPLVAKYLAENGVSGSIHFIPGIYPYGVSLLTSIHFRVPSLIFGPLVAKYLAENGVSGSIHFIPGMYPYGVSFLTSIHFHVPSLIFGPLMAKYLAENGISGIFLCF